MSKGELWLFTERAKLWAMITIYAKHTREAGVGSGPSRDDLARDINEQLYFIQQAATSVAMSAIGGEMARVTRSEQKAVEKRARP